MRLEKFQQLSGMASHLKMVTRHFDELLVRCAAVEDSVNIHRLLCETWHAAYDSILGHDEVEAKCNFQFSPEVIAYIVQRTRHRRMYVAEKAGCLVGVGQCNINMLGNMTVGLLYVHPEYQGQGIGTELMVYCAGTFPWARSLSIEVLEPNVSAIEFYENLGFRKAGWHHAPARASVPIVLMRRSLPERGRWWTPLFEYCRERYS